MKKNILVQRRGFTLVELMVAISIIGILSAIVYANFGGARQAARDDMRKTSLKEMQLAIEFYKAQNDAYPTVGCGATPAPANGGSNLVARFWANGECGQYAVGLTPDYIPTLPIDPSSEGGAGVGYMYASNGTDYKLMIKDTVEVKLTTAGDEYANGTSDSNTYTVYSAGAVNW